MAWALCCCPSGPLRWPLHPSVRLGLLWSRAEHVGEYDRVACVTIVALMTWYMAWQGGLDTRLQTWTHGLPQTHTTNTFIKIEKYRRSPTRYFSASENSRSIRLLENVYNFEKKMVTCDIGFGKWYSLKITYLITYSTFAFCLFVCVLVFCVKTVCKSQYVGL